MVQFKGKEISVLGCKDTDSLLELYIKTWLQGKVNKNLINRENPPA